MKFRIILTALLVMLLSMGANSNVSAKPCDDCHHGCSMHHHGCGWGHHCGGWGLFSGWGWGASYRHFECAHHSCGAGHCEKKDDGKVKDAEGKKACCGDHYYHCGHGYYHHGGYHCCGDNHHAQVDDNK